MTGLTTNHPECRDAERLLLALPDGELDPREAAELQTHLDVCPRCRVEAENLRRFRDLLRAEPRPDVPLPSGAEMLDRVRRHARRSPWSVFRPAWLAPAFALGLAALAISLQMRPHPARGPHPPVAESAQPGPPPALFVVDDERTGRQVLLAPAPTPAGGGS